jgi:hypothetical protein
MLPGARFDVRRILSETTCAVPVPRTATDLAMLVHAGRARQLRLRHRLGRGRYAEQRGLVRCTDGKLETVCQLPDEYLGQLKSLVNGPIVGLSEKKTERSELAPISRLGAFTFVLSGNSLW